MSAPISTSSTRSSAAEFFRRGASTWETAPLHWRGGPVAAITDHANAPAEKRAGIRVIPPFVAFLPITLVDFFFFVLPMLIMSIISVLVIREFHITLRLTAENYLFFLKNPLYVKILAKSLVMAL